MRRGPTRLLGLLVLTIAPLLLVSAMTPISSGASVDGRPTVSALTLSLGTVGRSASNLAPGDSLSESFDVGLSGRPNAKISLVITASRTSMLDSDVRNGLRVTIDRCGSLAGRLSPGRGVLSCGGGVSHVVANTPIASLMKRTLAVSGVRPGVVAHVRITLNLPATAGNAFENKRSALKFTFSAHS